MYWHRHNSNASQGRIERRLIRKYHAAGWGIYLYVRELVTRALSEESPEPVVEDTAEDIAGELGEDVELVSQVLEFAIAEGLLQKAPDGRVGCESIYADIDPKNTRSDSVKAMYAAYKAANQSEPETNSEEHVPDSPAQPPDTPPAVPDVSADAGDMSRTVADSREHVADSPPTAGDVHGTVAAYRTGTDTEQHRTGTEPEPTLPPAGADDAGDELPADSGDTTPAMISWLDQLLRKFGMRLHKLEKPNDIKDNLLANSLEEAFLIVNGRPANFPKHRKKCIAIAATIAGRWPPKEQGERAARLFELFLELTRTSQRTFWQVEFTPTMMINKFDAIADALARRDADGQLDAFGEVDFDPI